MRLGEYIRNERLNRGLSQKKLAEKINLSFVTINLIENDKNPGIKTLNALSEFFEVPIEQLRNMLEDKNENHKQ